MKRNHLLTITMAFLLSACGTSGSSSVDAGESTSQNTDDRIAVNSIEELKQLSSSSKKYKLVADLDFANVTEWSPIESFKGTLDGENHQITNFNLEFTAKTNAGLFGVLEGKVNQLSISGTLVGNGGCENVGLLCGTNKGTIDNVTSSGSVTAEYSSNVGGIAGYTYETISGCKNNASITGLNSVGGVSGYLLLRHNKSLSGGSDNTGAITGQKYIGGVFGQTYGEKYGHNGYDKEITISYCNNEGAVTASKEYAGGISGYVSAGEFGDDIDISYSKNKAEIKGTSYVGGLVGGATADLYKIQFCENKADITGTEEYVGGYVGGSEGSFIYDAVNENHITGKAYVGGIAGKISGLEDCENKGIVTCNGYLVSGTSMFARMGGVVGSAKAIKGCVNSGTMDIKTLGSNIGGVAGELLVSAATVGEIMSEYEYPTMAKNKNSASITCQGANVGGIVGAVSMGQPNTAKSYAIEFKENENTGAIDSNSNHIGGIVGYSSSNMLYNSYGGKTTFNTNTNSANINGHNYVGGILGYGNFVNETETIWATNPQTGEVTGDGYFGNLYGAINV